MEQPPKNKYAAPERAAEMVAEQYKSHWKKFIKEKIAEGMSPEDVRNPERLGRPSGEDYENLQLSFGKLVGYGEAMDRAIDEAITEALEE